MIVDPGISMTLLLVLGFLLQWLSTKIRIPAILPLLLMGIVLGPVLGWLDPDQAYGSVLFTLVSLAVAVILFEGSLTLRLSDLREIGNAVRGMVSYGAITAVFLLAGTAHWIAGISWSVAFLFGALTCVTGPTVITPLLRTLRPVSRVADTLRWEGIILDPLGALFAVLVFQAILTHQQGHSIAVFLFTIATGVLIGGLAAWLWAAILFHRFIAENLHNYGTLAAVLGVFIVSDRIASESGLLAVTIMGIVLGNSKVHVDSIMSFKKDLSLMLVSLLFIVLAARLSWPLPQGMLVAGLLVFLVAQIVVRPVSVWLSTLGSGMSWRERALLGFVAPRGVVAASVSSLFALRLQGQNMDGMEALVPLVFILIIATVVLQSVASRPVAKLLKVAAPEPTGVLIYGSNKVAQALAEVLHANDVDVILADENWAGIKQARMAGLPTFYGNPTSRHAELHLDLTPIGWLLAVSNSREHNHLVCLHYREHLERESVYRLQVLAPEDSSDRQSFAHGIRATALFGDDVTKGDIEDKLDAGWQVTSTTLSNTFSWEDFKHQHAEKVLLLFGKDGAGKLHIANDRHKVEPQSGWRVMALVAGDQDPHNRADDAPG